MDQGLEGLDRAAVGIQPELLAHRKQALFRTHLGGGVVVVLGIAHGTEQDRVGVQAGLVGDLREGVAVTVDGARSRVREMPGHLVSELAADGFHALDCLAGHFGADAVPGQKGNVEFHFR